MKFGDFVCLKRMEKKLTLRKFALAIGKSPAFVSDMEKGSCRPSDETLEKILDVLELNETESETLFDLLAHEKENSSPRDISSYIMQNDAARVALRTAKKLGATDDDWNNFISILEKKQQ